MCRVAFICLSDDPNNLWATYVRQVADYYGPRGVHHWIIWNEPDIAPDVYGHEFSGTITGLLPVGEGGLPGD